MPDGIFLNSDQSAALERIERENCPGRQHLLTGYAGSGKTTLVREFATRLANSSVHVMLSAPTHKAVAVLARKMPRSPFVGFATVHSLLSLVPDTSGEVLRFKVKPNAKPIRVPVVVIDECSMIGQEMFKHIQAGLERSFVLFVGDPAQLPPVHEPASEVFGLPHHSHLSQVVRQAQGNPILDAAGQIRQQQQGDRHHWRWCQSRHEADVGIYRPRDPIAWMRHAFLSAGFREDQDRYRYLCWTNERVHRINDLVREWIYGEKPPLPFMPGERALARTPVYVSGELRPPRIERTLDGQQFEVHDTKGSGDEQKILVMSTNEEVTVVTIRAIVLRCEIASRGELEGWDVSIPVYHLEVQTDRGAEVDVRILQDNRQAYNAAVKRLKIEAGLTRGRWPDYHQFRQIFSRLQHTYAMTIHTAQGSTFRNVFLDIGDVKRDRSRLEMQQLLYVGVTRPSHGLILVNDGVRRKLQERAVALEVTLADIIERDGLACYICGRITDPDAPAGTDLKSELEHEVPISRGGKHDWDNLRCACFRCNRRKGAHRTPEQVRESLVVGDLLL